MTIYLRSTSFRLAGTEQSVRPIPTSVPPFNRASQQAPPPPRGAGGIAGKDPHHRMAKTGAQRTRGRGRAGGGSSSTAVPRPSRTFRGRGSTALRRALPARRGRPARPGALRTTEGPRFLAQSPEARPAGHDQAGSGSPNASVRLEHEGQLWRSNSRQACPRRRRPIGFQARHRSPCRREIKLQPPDPSGDSASPSPSSRPRSGGGLCRLVSCAGLARLPRLLPGWQAGHGRRARAPASTRQHG